MGIFKKKKEKSTSKPSADFSSGVDTSEFYTKKKKKDKKSKFTSGIVGQTIGMPMVLPWKSAFNVMAQESGFKPSQSHRHNIDMEKQTKKAMDPADKLLSGEIIAEGLSTLASNTPKKKYLKKKKKKILKKSSGDVSAEPVQELLQMPIMPALKPESEPMPKLEKLKLKKEKKKKRKKGKLLSSRTIKADF